MSDLQHYQDPRRVGTGLVVFAMALAALLSLPGNLTAQTQGKQKIPLTVSGEFKLWLPNFDGAMQVGTETQAGSSIRLDRHLDLEEHPEVFDIGLGLGDIRYGKISANFLRFTAPGNKVLTTDINFDQVDFFAPETVHTDFSVEVDRISLSYVQDYKGAYFLSYEVGMAFFRWKTKIRNRHIGKDAGESTNATLPITGLHAVFPLGQEISIQLGFSGVFFQTGSDDVNLVDTYGELRMHLAKFLIVGLGYRHYRFDGDLDLSGGKAGELEFSMTGIYFTVGLKL
ncbi:MAG: hypothetical protein ACYTFG_13490 [Planctomycetota bacterium]|jgi:hypothetical protein